MSTIHSFIKKSTSIFILGVFTAANASTISLDSNLQTVQVGQEAIIQINMDFTGDPTIGGGIDVLFDNFTNETELSFLSYEAADLGDPTLRRDPDVEAKKLNSIAITDFQWSARTSFSRYYQVYSKRSR